MMPRWETFEPGCKDEEQARARSLQLVDQWWSDFSSRKSDIEALFVQKAQWDLAAWMRTSLQVIDSHFMWEFGPGLDGGHRLVVTPEHRFELRPLVNEILRRAPMVDGWSFFGHRLPEQFELALAFVEARTGVALAATGFQCVRGQFNLIDITIEFPESLVEKSEELAFSQAFALVQTVLGEDALNAWVGELGVAKKSLLESDIMGLASKVATLRATTSDSLSDKPICAEIDESKWSILKLEPTSADDYPAQTDIFVGKTMNVEQWQNAHCSAPFFSERYSKVGEVFCYLKVDGSEGLDDEVFKDKGEIEDALDDALISTGLGCIVGGGTGNRYSYVDLALTDFKSAIPVIRKTLQTGRLTKRSWLLFFDSEWATEWIGIWPDSPPPPSRPAAK